MAERIGLYGGSFDPIHVGHLIVTSAICERLDLRRMVFLPTASPPHKSQEGLADPAHRTQMVKLAIADEPRFEFSDFDLTRNGPSYTIDTVAHFREATGTGAELYWIIGADSLAELTTWHCASQLVEACRIITAARAGWEATSWDKLCTTLGETAVAKLRAGVLETPVIEISSTDIRRRIAQGKSIRYLVPDNVRTYIETQGLYRKT